MSLDRKAFLRPIAHRGLHDVATGCIENTRPAFERAIAQDFGIECDVRPMADGTPVVFHDATLERLTDASGRLDAIRADRFAGVHHRGSGQPLMLLTELLDLVRGRVPLLVEVKHDGGASVPGFLDRTAACAAAGGPVALMSFDTDVIDRLYQLAPALPIGLLAMRDPVTDHDSGDPTRSAIEARRDWLAFLAYRVDDLPSPASRLARDQIGLPVFAWTVRAPSQWALAGRFADAAIFEGEVQ